MATSNGIWGKHISSSLANSSPTTSRANQKNTTNAKGNRLKLKSNKVSPIDKEVTNSGVTNSDIASEKNSPEAATEGDTEDHYTSVDDDLEMIDLYKYILESRNKTGIALFPDKGNDMSGNSESIENKTIDSTNSKDDNASIDYQTASKEDKQTSPKEDSEQRINSSGNSIHSAQSWTNLSQCDSLFHFEDESDNDDDVGKVPGYLQSREHGFPQVGDFIETPIVDIDRQSTGTSKRWTDNKTLGECILHMQEHDIDCDVAIMVGKDQDVFKAHSFILTNRSPEFSDLLFSQMHLSDKFLLFQDISKDVMEQIIRHIYTDDADITVDSALEIIPVTGVTGPRGLRDKCFRHLLAEINSDIACTVLEYAHMYGHVDIYYKCLRFIHVNAKDIFKTNSFFDLCVKCLDDITKSDYLNTDEYSVFDVLMTLADKWCSQKKLELNDVNRRKVTESLLFNVRFATLSMETYLDRINKRRILHSNEKKEILKLLHGKTDNKRSQYIIHPRKKYNTEQYFVREAIVGGTREDAKVYNGKGDRDEISTSVTDSGVSSKTEGSDRDYKLYRNVKQEDDRSAFTTGKDDNIGPTSTENDNANTCSRTVSYLDDDEDNDSSVHDYNNKLSSVSDIDV